MASAAQPAGAVPLPEELRPRTTTPASGSAFDRLVQHPTAIPWFYLGAITAAEIETGLVSIWYGLALHCLILLVLPLHAALARGRPYERLLICLVVAPLIRILSLTLPLIGFPMMDWYLLVSVPVFVFVFMLARVFAFTRNDLGLVWRRGGVQLVVALGGPILGWMEYRILNVQTLAPAPTLAGMLPPALILVFCTGLMEEVTFRGLLQRTSFGLFFDDGVLYVSLLFAALHTGYRSLPDSVFVFCVGVLFAILTRRTGSISGVTAAHGLANVTLYVVAPLYFPRA